MHTHQVYDDSDYWWSTFTASPLLSRSY